MSEEERLEREQLERERKWVKARFNCTVENMLDELATLIQFDVREFNRLSGKREVKINNLDDGAVTFSRDNRTVSISTDGKVIMVIVTHGNTQVSDLEIQTEWNKDTVYCDLVINDEKVSTHRASQIIIGDLLFGHD